MTIATETKSATLARLPSINAPLPGPKAQEVIAYDKKFMSPSLTRDYPLVAHRAYGSIVEDPDGNVIRFGSEPL